MTDEAGGFGGFQLFQDKYKPHSSVGLTQLRALVRNLPILSCTDD
jgi:hypothetical protein